MNTRHYVNALFIMERSKDAPTIFECIDYIVDELHIYSSEEVDQILIHLLPMVLDYY
jgi:hypothetical protein